jgi:transposase
LEEADLHPHRSRYWLNAKPADPEVFAAEVREVCDVYQQATTLAEAGVRIMSTDEKTGMQALERLHPTLPMVRGLVERVEFEYVRHGTQTLIANFDVCTGAIVSPTIGDTRTEPDFAAHIDATIDTDPDKRWVFIADQLNTHMSEALVRLVAKRCGIDVDLGVKGKSGVLESMKTRKRFLADKSHRIRFVYTPKHTSWLNQVEIWFGVLGRRLLRRGSFASTDELARRVLDFIDYFNRTMARPYRWTYSGRPLVA